MTRERASDMVINGVRYFYAYRNSWGIRYYSFDGDTWHTTKREAFVKAEQAGKWIMTPRPVEAPTPDPDVRACRWGGCNGTGRRGGVCSRCGTQIDY